MGSACHGRRVSAQSSVGRDVRVAEDWLVSDEDSLRLAATAAVALSARASPSSEESVRAPGVARGVRDPPRRAQRQPPAGNERQDRCEKHWSYRSRPVLDWESTRSVSSGPKPTGTPTWWKQVGKTERAPIPISTRYRGSFDWLATATLPPCSGCQWRATVTARHTAEKLRSRHTSDS
jgi:hypothetical protein